MFASNESPVCSDVPCGSWATSRVAARRPRLPARLFLRIASLSILALALRWIEPATAAAFQLSGQVTDASLNPIANVDVVVENASNNLPVASGTTDTGGNFALSVPAGSYNVVLTPPAGSGFGVSTTPLSIAGDTLVDFTLVPLVQFVSFSGTLRDGSTQPVSGQTITICNGYWCSTDANGYFSMAGIAPGVYSLSVTGGGGTLPSSYSVSVGIDLSGDRLQDLTLPPTAQLTVTVKDPGSTGVPNANVSVSGGVNFALYPGGSASASSGASGTTDAGGTVQFLLFDGSGVSAYAYPPSGSGLYSGGNSTTMAGTTALAIDLTAIPLPVSFSGVLRDSLAQPVANQTITICNGYYCWDNWHQTTTDTNGNFSIAGIFPGGYALYVSGGGGGTVPDSYSVSGGIDLSSDRVQDLLLPPTALLTVTVRDPTSQGVPNTSVNVYTGGVGFELYPGGGASASSSASGITDAGGTSQFRLFDGSGVSAYAYPPGGSNLYSGSGTTTMAGDTALAIDLAAIPPPPPPVSFSGTLRDSGGQPAVNQTITICNGYYCWDNWHQTTTDTNGYFSMSGIAPGSYSLYISGGGGTLPDSYSVSGGIDLSVDTAQDLSLPPAAQLTITVKDPASQAVPNTTVYTYTGWVSFELYPGGGASASADNGASGLTDGNGTIQFRLFDGSSVSAYAYPPNGSGLNSGSGVTTMSGDTPLEIDLAWLVSFSGVLADSAGTALPNQTVCLTYDWYCASTDNLGTFSVTGVPPGAYQIYVRGGGGALPDSFYLYGPTVNLTADRVQNLSLPLITLTVTVVGPQGVIPGVQVSVPWWGSVTTDLFAGGPFSGGLAVTRTTDANGIARLPLIASSTVQLTATPPAGSAFLPSTLSSRTFSASRNITIVLQSLCGDGVIQSGEQCDDRNLVSGDGCSNVCQIEPCHECSGAPSWCVVLSAGAACPDDGNACTTDLCDAGGQCTHAVGNAGALCRPAGGECDIPDTCTGMNAGCTDRVKPDETPCGGGDGMCAAGVCEFPPPPLDSDQDRLPDAVDNCRFDANMDQHDADDDGLGDACDNCPNDFNAFQTNVCGRAEDDRVLESAGALRLKRVRLQTARDGVIRVTGFVDTTAYGGVDAFVRALRRVPGLGGVESLDIRRGSVFAFNVSGAGLGAPGQTFWFPACPSVSGCTGVDGESARFVRKGTTNLFQVVLAAQGLALPTPLGGAPATVTLALGGIDAREQAPCRTYSRGRLVTCRP